MVDNFGANTLSILLNNGSGGFTASGAPLATGNNPYAVTVGDLDGDGDLDIATTNSGSSSVSVFRNNGSAGFTPADGSPFAVGVSPGGIVMGDFNEDGVLDLSTANFGSNTTSILINDVNDRILFQSSDGTPAIWLMNGLGTVFVGAVGPFNPGPSWHVKESGDFNGDSKSDILWQNDDGTPAIWLMNGSHAAGQQRRRLVQSGTYLAHQGHRRLQRRQQVRHPVAERQRHARDLADERFDRAGQQRRRLVQSGTDLADQGHRRLQRRRQVRHPVAERQRHARDLADERLDRAGQQRRRSRSIRDLPGTSRAPATSTATAGPTSCGRTTTARPRSG